MPTDTPPMTPRSGTMRMRAVGLLAAGAIAGGIIAGTLTANADPSSGSSGSSGTTSTTAPAPDPGGRPPMGLGGPAPVRSDESTPSDDIVATLTKKAEAEVPGGTVIRVETDAGDGAYEAHMTKANGRPVTVKFDKNLDVIGVEDGMGQGDPLPTGAGAPPGPGNAESGTQSG